jgi:GNAT acetyltransferase-like protein
VVVRRDGRPVAGAQVELVTLPLARLGIARVFWGPVWKRRDAAPEPADLDAALDALRAEFAERRRMLLRVVPREETTTSIGERLERAGWARHAEGYRTVVLDLPASADELRQALHQNWRRNLAKGLHAELRVESGTDAAAYEVFMRLYGEMRARKSFESTLDPAAFRLVRERLPENWRPRIFTASKEGVPLASIICSLQGDTGIYLFGASADAALPLRASYVAHWHAIRWLIDAGAVHYDLGGANPANAGTYQFKSGTGGRHVEFIGEFELAGSLPSRLAVHAAEAAREGVRALRRRFARRAAG